MAGKRLALIIASYEYEDPDLRQLVAPAQDSESLKRVLKDPDIGGFEEVQMLLNERCHIVSEEIEAFFADRDLDDMLLLYFSGHGIKDEDGRLYFAAINTKRKKLHTTAIPATLIHDLMRRSRSRRQVLLLDCCYSGAFARGMVAKSDKTIGIKEFFEEGRGCIVLTSSDAMQYSFEGNKVEGQGVRSVFTFNLVRGLKTGEADLNKDGLITVDELYDYIFDLVSKETPNQRPEKWAFDVQGDIVIARNTHLGEEPLVLQEGLPQPEMVRIPAGKFSMGSEEYESEKPIHQVVLQEFYIGRYPVTNREYRAFVLDISFKPPTHWKQSDDPEIPDDHPVVWVSWYDAIAYCQWLSKKTGKLYRLPTEAEWEKAAGWDPRAKQKRQYPWGDEWNENNCNSRKRSLGQTTSVFQYSPHGDSPYGGSDLSGNVREWCSSQFKPYPYQANDGREDLELFYDRVLKGGAFSDQPNFLRCAFRFGCHPKSRDNNFGFRIALSSLDSHLTS